MKKRIVSVAVAAVLAAGVLAGCGSKGGDGGTITVAATEVPHSEILEAAKPILAEKGWDLQVTVFNDYVQPNEVVEAGDFDCNYFQHTPYLDSFNAEKGTHLVNVGEIHYEPLGIYGGTESDLANISDGATIAVPNDTTNEARALLRLQDLACDASDSEAAKTYVNVIVVKEGNEENEGVKALVEVLKSDEISKFINDKYQGSVVPFK